LRRKATYFYPTGQIINIFDPNGHFAPIEPVSSKHGPGVVAAVVPTLSFPMLALFALALAGAVVLVLKR
jgi:hypothetical protein